MSTEIDELRRLLAEEQRLRREDRENLTEEQRLRAEEQRLRAEEQRLRAEEERLRMGERERTSKTNLPTFLDGLHNHLFLGLGVQKDGTKSTRGDPANATEKLRPRKLKAWDSFPEEQEHIWRSLMDSSLVEDRLFTSLHTLEETGEGIRRQPVGSELDLHHFLRQNIEDHVSKIIEELYNDPTLRQVFGLRGSIRFENHSNTLSPERELEEGMQNIDIRATHDPRTPLPVQRPRADQFCVYNIPSQSSELIHSIAAYVKEYKSPHKVTLGHIYKGLEDMDLDKVVEKKEHETLKDRCHRAIAALLVQPYDYMIRAGTEMGVLSTGEADIYLRLGEDPRTLLYYLSVPKGDVGEFTGWDPHSSGPNRLHLTAVGQSLAFTLQALKLRPRNQAWREQTSKSLPRWKVVVANVLDGISPKEVSSEYRPPQSNGLIRTSPIQLRHKRQPIISSCQPIDVQGNSDHSDDNQPDPDTPSRAPRISRNIERRHPPPTHPTSTPATQGSSGENNRRYCTLKCLRGLLYGGELDQACPNFLDHGTTRHGTTRHVINAKSFIKLLRHQLAKTVNADCEALGIHGSRGALLKVTLSSHGYTVPAKCTIPEFTDRLRHEAALRRYRISYTYDAIESGWTAS
ncbi:hypothetical protein N7516_001865 [Penicillium verrucosum]|uniref:uncharacterized protein n=1 Tax=Penicillium verrucosum TaxID=60171 RepID=UPI002545BBB2|nr:uncharacterized protein N7516_001865 [Penicillium verrucosum]KAJ5941697.1 hypothetical protein N7516_001865 [Penicillium verrucosum]